jgi:hypothetical protein
LPPTPWPGSSARQRAPSWCRSAAAWTRRPALPLTPWPGSSARQRAPSWCRSAGAWTRRPALPLTPWPGSSARQRAPSWCRSAGAQTRSPPIRRRVDSQARCAPHRTLTSSEFGKITLGRLPQESYVA